MNDIVYTKSYEDYKVEVGTELSKASESFVRIGYLLKVARDTAILQGTEYEGNYVKFAEAEFGLEKTQVSRFIRINDKFSVNGNSPELIEQYKGFGTRKLGIMLLLPDSLTEELTPDFTVEDIEEIRNEVKEEDSITPLEQYAETIENESYPNMAADHYEESMLSGAIYSILEERADLFEQICLNRDDIVKIMAPVKEQTYITRIKGKGRVMVIFHEKEIAVVNARTSEKEKYPLEQCEWIIQNMILPYGIDPAREMYKKIFGKEFPEKEEPKTEEIGSKETEKAEKEPVKTKNESKRVQNGVKDAKKKQSKKAEADKHRNTDEGIYAKEAGEYREKLAAEQSEVDGIQPEGSAGENQTLGEENIGGTGGESLSSGTGETLSCEDTGASGGEGNAAGTVERSKYSGRLEQLSHDISILAKEIDSKGKPGVAGANWKEDALKTSKMISECIQTIIKDLEAEEEKNWRELPNG